MEEQIIKWGIIGCGDVTEVKSGPAFSKVPHSKLVAVMRRNGEKARDYAERHGVRKWYSDADALINDLEVNAIYVATPPLYHEDYAIRALQAGKPVYVEKPMALDAAAAARIEDVARATGVKVSVAHYRREQPLFLKVRELLQQKAIGDVRLVDLKLFQPHQSHIIAKSEINWRIDPSISGGGLFYDLAPHQLDLMLYFFGKPRKVSGMSYNSTHYYEADDVTCGQILFESGVVFNGAWCFTAGERKDLCEIIGSEGKLSFPVFDHKKVILEKNGSQTTFDFEPLQHVQEPMIEKVVRYFLGHSDNPCPAEDGVAVMRMMEGMSKTN